MPIVVRDPHTHGPQFPSNGSCYELEWTALGAVCVGGLGAVGHAVERFLAGAGV